MIFNDERRLSSVDGQNDRATPRLRAVKPLLTALTFAALTWTAPAAVAQPGIPFRLGLSAQTAQASPTAPASAPAPAPSPASATKGQLPAPTAPPLAPPPAPRTRPQAPAAEMPSVRIRDVAHIAGTNANPLVGYGLVIGLQGTGDTQGTIAQQMLTRMMQTLGNNQPVTNQTNTAAITLKNSAVVMLTADLPAYSKPGDAIDVRVSSVADAKSLVGGVLAVSLLKAADGQVYASAQGPLVVGDRATTGVGIGLETRKPHLNSGIVLSGGLVSRAAPATRLDSLASLQWILNKPDFEIASKVAAAINRSMPGLIAVARDSTVVEVNLANYEAQGPTVDIVAQMGQILLDVETSKVSGKITFDTRDGEILEGADVRIRGGVVHAAGTRIEVGPAGATVGDVLRYLAQLGVPTARRAEALRALCRDRLLRADLRFQAGASEG